MEIINELKNIFGDTIRILSVYGITVTGYEVECHSYSRYAVFEYLMKKYQKQFENSSTKVIYTECGNYLILNIGEPITPFEFVKQLRNYYQPHDKVCEVKEDGNNVLIIVKPRDKVHENMLYYDLTNCGFEVIDDAYPFIIAVTKIKNVG